MSDRTARRGRGKVTIADVARVAGVSPMTVSRVINDGSSVSEKTRTHVEAVIRRLGYRPDIAARSLAGFEAVRVGLLYNNPSAAYLSELLVGVLESASRRGVQVTLERGVFGGQNSDALDKLRAAGIDGVLLPPPLCEDRGILRHLEEADVPCVSIASSSLPLARLSVSIDDFSAAKQMTEYLIGLGHRAIGFIKGHPNQTASRERFRGYEAALHEADLNPEPQALAQGYFTYQSGLEAAQQILASASRPSAIFASNDDMAAAVSSTAHRLGIDVPRDLSIAGFDDTSAALNTFPELTTVRQPIDEMAKVALEMLVEAVEQKRRGVEPEPQSRILPHEIVLRQSTVPPSAARNSVRI